MLFSLDAERHLLGSVLRAGSVLDEIATELTAEDFAMPFHKKLFAVMIDLAGQQKPIDLVTLADVFGLAELDRHGGMTAIVSLFEGVPVASDIGYYVRMVKGYAKRRALKRAGEKIAELAGDNSQTADDAVAAAEAELAGLQTGMTSGADRIGGLALGTLTRLAKAAAGKRSGIDSGIRGVDRILGGLQPCDLIVIGARPSMGKTAFAVTVAENIARQGYGVIFFSLEMSKESLADRMILGGAGIQMWAVRAAQRITPDDQERARIRVEGIHMLPLLIDDDPLTTIEAIASRSRFHAREFQRAGVPLGCIVVDYLTYVRTTKKYERRDLEVGDITRSLKVLARQLAVPVILLAQLNRGLEARTDKRPTLGDLRDSGAVEQDADVCAFLYRHSVYDQQHNPRDAELLVRKHRNGMTGDVPLLFIGERMRFEDAGYIGQDRDAP